MSPRHDPDMFPLRFPVSTQASTRAPIYDICAFVLILDDQISPVAFMEPLVVFRLLLFQVPFFSLLQHTRAVVFDMRACVCVFLTKFHYSVQTHTYQSAGACLEKSVEDFTSFVINDAKSFY